MGSQHAFPREPWEVGWEYRDARRIERALGLGDEARPFILDYLFTTKGAAHTGLGLSIAHQVVTGHLAGTIEIDSDPGEGTSCAILLPTSDEISGSHPRVLTGVPSRSKP